MRVERAVHELIPPHGGVLQERLVKGSDREELLRQAGHLPSITLDERSLSDVELFAIGAYSPLTGFLREKDYDSVVERMRLADGTVWPVPITLSLLEKEADVWKEGADLALKDQQDQVVAILRESELYPYHRLVEAKLVYGVTDQMHPGVNRLRRQGPYYLGGTLEVLNCPSHSDFRHYRMTPAHTREQFRLRRWKRVVGFQTQNPVDRAREYVLRCALEIADGVLIQPLVGQTTADDEISAAVRVRCYEALMAAYLPPERVMLVVNPSWVRYAGQREMILQAIIRQNYGCSHFILGRNQTYGGALSGVTDVEQLFDSFSEEELQIAPFCFDNLFYCRVCGGMATVKTCPHTVSERSFFSGTALKQMLMEGKSPPAEFTRPEIAEILKEAYQKP